jgi:hypothetical protein
MTIRAQVFPVQFPGARLLLVLGLVEVTRPA